MSHDVSLVTSDNDAVVEWNNWSIWVSNITRTPTSAVAAQYARARGRSNSAVDARWSLSSGRASAFAPFSSPKTFRWESLLGVSDGGWGRGITVPDGPGLAGWLGHTLGDHHDAVRLKGRERQGPGVWVGRSPAASPLRELLGLIQRLLRARPVGVDLVPLRHSQGPLLAGHRSVLPLP